jgi:hypothetical protein
MKETIIQLDDSLKPQPIEKRKYSLIGLDMGGNKFIRQENIGKVKHRNYLDYLEVCYANHYSPVVKPDFIWYELLCELAIMVKANPETFKKFFTASKSKEKTELVVLSESLDKLPLDQIMELFETLVPSGSDNYIPVFSTSTPDSTEAFYAAFADAVSPYYNYSMLLCGFPAMVIQGTAEDWTKLSDYWKNLFKLGLFADCPKAIKDYVKAVQTVLDLCRDTIVTGASIEEHWKKMFWVENCGSGHEREVKGWITKLFQLHPRPGYSKNFSSHVSKVNYTQLNTMIKYSAYYGLFSSEIDGNILRPKYGCIITQNMEDEKKKEPKKKKVPDVIKFKIYSQKIDAKARKLEGVWASEENQELEMLPTSLKIKGNINEK